MSEVVSVRRIALTVLQAYDKVDAQVQAQAKKLGATCTKGCAACCYQLVTMNFAEALSIGVYVMESFEAEAIDALLVNLDVLAEELRGRPTRASTFLAKKPCLFLDVGPDWTGLCSIYTVRPAACRMQYVVSDPKLCAPERTNECHIVDTLPAQTWVLAAISHDDPVLSKYGPMAPLLAHALHCLRSGTAPSLLELTEWQDRMMQMLDYERAVQERASIVETYVK